MKLYRGLKTDEFSLRTSDEEQKYKQMWRKLLKKRAQSDFSYPHNLNKEIIELHKQSKLTYQHFTDRKEVAANYAQEKGGLLLEMGVPVEKTLSILRLSFRITQKGKKDLRLFILFPAKNCVKGNLNGT